ncbi:MAG: hypothetical protein ACK2UW_12425, partial [Anaerolineales bacterium]
MSANRRRMLFIWLIVFGFSGVACNFFTRRTEPVVSPTVVITQTVPEPVETTPPSGSLKDRIEAAVDEYKSSGVFKVTINETELTELVADQLSSQSDPMLTNPKVTLRDGHITITGVVSQSGLSLDSEIVMAPYVDMDGLPAVEIVSMTVGPFSVPEDIQAQVN